MAPLKQVSLAPPPEPEVISGLRSVRRSEQESFLNALRGQHLIEQLGNDEVFVKALDLALSHYGVRQGVLADRLGVSTGQVGRWRAWKSVPPAYGRGLIIDTLADALEAELNESERDEGSGGKTAPSIATLSDAALIEIGRAAGKSAVRRAVAAGVPVATLDGDEVKLTGSPDLDPSEE